MLALAFTVLLAAAPPLALRAEVSSLGRGPLGTVVGIAVQVAPEDRERIGERVRVEVLRVKGETVTDRHVALIPLEADGSALIYREWPAGDGEVRVILESLDGTMRGGWRGSFVVPVEQQPFAPPEGSAADAAALAMPPAEGAVRFLPPPRTGGIGALQLEVVVPPETARVEFFQDEQPLVQRGRAPWTVSVTIGEVARRTLIRAAAFRADGAFIGEDAIVLNAARGQLPVSILLGPLQAGGRSVTVSVGGSTVEEVVLRGDDETLARWSGCPCSIRLDEAKLAGVKVLAAEARDRQGTRGEAVKVVGEEGFVAEIRVEQVELPVVVVDRQGRLVTDLPPGAFRVLEDGVEVTLDSVATQADLPLSLGLMVDVSGSMRDSFGEVRAAVDAFTKSLLRPGDSMFLMTFAWEAKVVLPWTGQAEAVAPVLERVVPEGGTSLHDAVVRALEQFRARRGRNAVVLLSDGEDTTSRTGWDITERFVRTARTPIFPIGFKISALDLFTRARLKELAAATGGESFFASKGSLDDVYRRIGEQLRAQYILTYRSPSARPADAFRTVTVEVAGEGLTARTIAGYYPSY